MREDKYQNCILTLVVAAACGTGGQDDGGQSSEGITTSPTDSDTGVTSGGERFDVGSSDMGMITGGDPGESACRKVDFLFVIDNSQSFEGEQQSLIASFPGFIQTVQNTLQDIDSYHLGITTSDAYACTPAPCNVPGALVTGTCGNFSSNMACGPYAEGKTYMTQADDLATTFACAGQVGTSGDFNEQPMFILGAAVDPAINAVGACNDGFIRDDALLVVVIITDEEDDHETMCNLNPGSPGEPVDWFNTLVAHKGGIQSNIVVLSLVGPAPPDDCPPRVCGGVGAEECTRILEFTAMFTHAFVGQVCAPTYDAFFQDAVSVINSACGDFTPPG